MLTTELSFSSPLEDVLNHMKTQMELKICFLRKGLISPASVLTEMSSVATGKVAFSSVRKHAGLYDWKQMCRPVLSSRVPLLPVVVASL